MDEETQYVIDEIRVQVIVRKVVDGETVDKSACEPLVFVNERVFREWASQPFSIDSRPAA